MTAKSEPTAPAQIHEPYVYVVLLVCLAGIITLSALHITVPDILTTVTLTSLAGSGAVTATKIKQGS